MKTALFTNYSSEAFTGYWDGKPKKFAPGQSLYMPDWLARHFARGLANRELIKLGKERSTSPKFPEQVPDYMEQFNKAYQPDLDEETLGGEQDSIDTLINVAAKNRARRVQLLEGAQGIENRKDQTLSEVNEYEPDDKDAYQPKPDESKLAA